MDLGSLEKTWTTKTVVPIKGILEEVNIPALLPGKSHGRRSLVGCGPRGR